MNWQHVIISGFVGVIAVVLITAMRRKQWIGKISGVAIFIAIIAVWNFWGVNYLLPGKTFSEELRQAETAMSKLPVYRTIKESDPVFYNQLQGKMVRLKREGKSEQELIDIIQMDISSFLISRLYYAPDDKVVAQMNNMLIQIEKIQAYGGDSCFKFLFPAVSGGINPIRILPEEIMQQRMQADNDLIAASYITPRTVNKAQEIEAAKQALQPILQQMQLQYGDDLQMVVKPEAENVDRKKACEIMRHFYKSILSLPQKQSAAVLRMVLSS
ncbi:hypothetical protein RBA63_04795 [Brenneria goodwinii]|uniref:hypothetical protein n=1 Tax=Brenneria goodwinii TaxID=1109412 RepID=UPI0036E780FA